MIILNGEDEEEWNYHTLLVGVYLDISPSEKNLSSPGKVIRYIPYKSTISTPGQPS